MNLRFTLIEQWILQLIHKFLMDVTSLTPKFNTEEGTWSEDGKIYTVNHELRLGAADGINRIRVQGAQDLDYF